MFLVRPTHAVELHVHRNNTKCVGAGTFHLPCTVRVEIGRPTLCFLWFACPFLLGSYLFMTFITDCTYSHTYMRDFTHPTSRLKNFTEQIYMQPNPLRDRDTYLTVTYLFQVTDEE